MEIYAPVCFVEIGGTELPVDLTNHRESFSYEDAEEEMDEVRVNFVDPDLQLVDNPLLREGKELRCRWGYLGNLSRMRTCTIKEIDYTYPEDGLPRITLKALDNGCKLTGRAARTCWKSATLATVAKDIARKHSLAVDLEIPGDYEREGLSQGGKNDMEFLRGLSKEHGCAMWVDEKIHIKPNKPGSSKPLMVMGYRVDQDGYLLSMRIKASSEKNKGISAGTEVTGIDPLSKEAIEEKAENATTYFQVSLANDTPPVEKCDEAGKVVPTPGTNAKTAEQAAKAKVAAAAMQTIEASARTIGIPALEAKSVIVIEGIGTRFSGRWRVKKARHELSMNGYFCDLELAREEVGGAKQDAKKSDADGTPPQAADAKAPATVRVDLK